MATVLDFPDVHVEAEDVRPIANRSLFRSPLAGTTQEIHRPGARWGIAVTVAPQTEDQWRSFQVFLARVAMQGARIRYRPRHAREARGTALGSPVVEGDGQTGTTLRTKGWSAGATLLSGDWISFAIAGREALHLVTADVTASSAGEATLSVVPPVRTAPASGTGLRTADTSGIFLLAGEAPALPHRPATIVDSLTLQLEEALI